MVSSICSLAPVLQPYHFGIFISSGQLLANSLRTFGNTPALMGCGRIQIERSDRASITVPLQLEPQAAAPMENSIVSKKARDNNSLDLSDSTVIAEQASVTAEGTSTSALGDEPTYDEQVCEDIEGDGFSEVTDPCVRQPSTRSQASITERDGMS